MSILKLDFAIRHPSSNGFVLIGVLSIMSILIVLVSSFSFMVRSEMKITSFLKDSNKNYYSARAGIHRAAGVIALHAAEPANGPVLSWWRDKRLYKDIPYNGMLYSIINPSNFRSGRGGDSNTAQGAEKEFEYGVDDEESRLNINIATPEMLMQFPGITSVLAEEILIFRVKKQNREQAPQGQEEKSLVDGPIFDIDELLQIKGMTRRILYGANQGIGSMADNLTCFSSGKINVNSARPMVFKALGFTDEEVNTIMQYHKLSGEIFSSVPEFIKELGLEKSRHNKISSLLCVKSANFRLACVVRNSDIRSKSAVVAGLSIFDRTVRFRLWETIPQGMIQ